MLWRIVVRDRRKVVGGDEGRAVRGGRLLGEKKGCRE